jgi:hypothetical protein
MQRKSRGVLLALVAVFAMSAVTAAAASATTPEFKPVPAKKKFTATGGAMSAEFYGVQLHYECTKSATTGEVTGSHTLGNIVMTFTGCKVDEASGVLGGPIHTKGAKEGEVVTAALGGELGTVTKSGATALNVGERGVGKDEKWASILSSEGGNYGAIYGSVAAEVAPIGKKQTTLKLYFPTTVITEITLDSGIVEKPELETDVDGGVFSTTDELKFEEAVEVT